MSAAVDPLDFVDVDALLTPEERATRDSVREFVHREVLPGINGWYDEGRFPVELAPEFGKLGLLGMHLGGSASSVGDRRQQYGCPGRSAVEYGLACLELEAGDSGFRSFASVQGSLSMYALWRFGSEEQKQEWLPRMAAGEAIGCFGLTEPAAGSNPGAMQVSARENGTDWVLNGVKRWSTNGTIADVAIVWAKAGADVVRGFVVPTDTPGFEATPINNKLSLRASASAELHLTDVRLPGDAVLPNVEGLRGPFACLNEARFGVLWGAMGAARACYAAALERSKEREQFGKPIGGFQLTQAKLVDMLVELEKGTLLALHLGRMKDEGRLAPQQVSLGKLNNVREAMAIARSARTVLGGEGITTDYPVMRHANNLESVLTYEGTQEMHQLIIGQSITGLKAFS